MGINHGSGEVYRYSGSDSSRGPLHVSTNKINENYTQPVGQIIKQVQNKMQN